jgi:hypothetical protein
MFPCTDPLYPPALILSNIFRPSGVSEKPVMEWQARQSLVEAKALAGKKAIAIAANIIIATIVI